MKIYMHKVGVFNPFSESIMGWQKLEHGKYWDRIP